MAQHLLLELQSSSLISRMGLRIWVIIVAISLVCPLGRVQSTATAPPILLGSDTVVLDPTLEAGLSAVIIGVSDGLKTLPSGRVSQTSIDQKGIVLPKERLVLQLHRTRAVWKKSSPCQYNANGYVAGYSLDSPRIP